MRRSFMYIELKTVVQKIIYENEKIQIVATSSGAKKAIVYRDILERVEENDIVVVNHTANVLKLGTGGFDIVKHIFNKKPYVQNSSGHIMKLRYTPQQLSVITVEEEGSMYHHLFTKEFSLNGQYILLAELHSMIPVIYQMLKQFHHRFTLTVIIDDEASLPLALSEHLRILHENENFHSITIGQSFGGQFEAVNLHTALQFAHVYLRSDYIVVSLGPGVVGTSSQYGFSGMILANWANIIGSFDGIPIWIPRISFAEQRERHIGISHHTMTPLKQFTYAKSILPLPNIKDFKEPLMKQLKSIEEKKHISVYWEQVDEQIIKNAIEQYPIPIKTMGRTLRDDPHFFYGIFSAVKWLVMHT